MINAKMIGFDATAVMIDAKMIEFDAKYACICSDTLYPWTHGYTLGYAWYTLVHPWYTLGHIWYTLLCSPS